jgi:MFS transporter, ACS family, glucarate transporter
MTLHTLPEQKLPTLAYASPPTRVRYQVMAFLGALSFLTYFDRVCIMRAQGDIQRDLGLTDTQMGWVLGAFWLAYGLFEIPVGWWGDRFGARRTLTRIVLAWSLFTALSGTATGFLSLLAFRFLFGVGEAGAYPNMARVQSRWLPLRSRARAGGMLWLMARWGGAFSPIIFGTMLRAFSHLEPIAHVAAWRMGFWASGLIGLVWVALFYPWFRDDPAEKETVNEAELALIRAGRPPSEPSHSTPPGMWWGLFTCPSLWALALLYLCGSFGWSFFVSWMPRFLRDVHQVSFQRSELMNAMPLFFGGISCLVGGWLSDLVVKRTGWRRLGRGIFPVIGCTTAAMAMLGIRFVDTPAQAVALMCLAAAAFDFGQGANWATIVDIGGNYAGTATGFINMVGNMGNFIQPVVGAVIFNHFGWPTLFVVYTGAYLVAATMWLFIDPRRKFHEHLPETPEPCGFDVVRPGES